MKSMEWSVNRRKGDASFLLLLCSCVKQKDILLSDQQENLVQQHASCSKLLLGFTEHLLITSIVEPDTT